jgi:predicted nucleic-acid-binding protein
MHAIDTNVLVRLITRDDPRQVELAEKFVSKGAWVSHLVLAEAMWVLSAVYELPSREIALAVEMLLKHDRLTVQDAEVAALALAHFRKRPSLGFSDCLVVEIARKAGHAPLGTFDRDLSRIEGTEKL